MTTKYKLHTKEQVKLGNRVALWIIGLTLPIWIPTLFLGATLRTVGEFIEFLVDYLDDKADDFSYWLARKIKK